MYLWQREKQFFKLDGKLRALEEVRNEKRIPYNKSLVEL